jgi:hypothetical protein
MPKLPLIAATSALGFACVAAAVTTVKAEMADTPPSDGIECYYNMYHCSYYENGYWSGCNPAYGEGFIPTSVARAICTKYHAS